MPKGIDDMFAILMYDVSSKRVQKVFKTASKYMIHEQNSVFIGRLTDSKLKALESEIKTIMKEEDKYVIYHIENERYLKRKSNIKESDTAFF